MKGAPQEFHFRLSKTNSAILGKTLLSKITPGTPEYEVKIFRNVSARTLRLYIYIYDIKIY